jgi:hypothetical protein
MQPSSSGFPPLYSLLHGSCCFWLHAAIFRWFSSSIQSSPRKLLLLLYIGLWDVEDPTFSRKSAHKFPASPLSLFHSFHCRFVILRYLCHVLDSFCLYNHSIFSCVEWSFKICYQHFAAHLLLNWAICSAINRAYKRQFPIVLTKEVYHAF